MTMHEVDWEQTLEAIVRRDARYHREAYRFVRQALDQTRRKVGRRAIGQPVRPVTGQQLLDGIRLCALDQFGPMALTVLQEWGVRSCEDLGEIVFNLVDAGLLSKTELDTRDDLRGGYDFAEAFRKPFQPAGRGRGAAEAGRTESNRPRP